MNAAAEEARETLLVFLLKNRLHVGAVTGDDTGMSIELNDAPGRFFFRLLIDDRANKRCRVRLIWWQHDSTLNVYQKEFKKTRDCVFYLAKVYGLSR